MLVFFKLLYRSICDDTHAATEIDVAIAQCHTYDLGCMVVDSADMT